MKKLFISALALAAFTACSQEEIVEQQASVAIAFDGAFVDNVTRAADPSTTTEDIQEFNVWAFMDKMGGDVFNEERVSKQGTDWTYENIQYWTPNHTYYFAALSPCVDNNVVKVKTATTDEALKLGLGTVTFKNVAGETDLIYDALTVQTTDADYLIMPKVRFTFKHLLSKVKFTFKNGFKNANNTIQIMNLRMDVPGAGSIDLATGDWWTAPEKWILDETANVTTLEFGNVNGGEKLSVGASNDCAKERLTIPAVASQKYTVTFDVVLYSGDVVAFKRTITTTIEGVALEMGKAYNFTATLDATNIDETALKPIEFEVLAINKWDEQENNFITTLTGVTVKEGQTLTLSSDAEVKPSTFNVAGTLYGAGHELKAINVEGKEPKMVNLTKTGASVANLTIDGESNFTYNLYITGAGEYYIDNVTSENGAYALNAQGKAVRTLHVTNSTFAGWVSYATATTANFTECVFKPGSKYNTIKPYGQTYFKNCTFSGTDYTISLAKLGSGKTVTFDNCYVGEVKITEKNIKTLVNVEGLTEANVEFK